MTTFDGWNTLPRKRPMAGSSGHLSEDELMHFRTKGSKNGVRRYQMADGTWTPLGLRERKAREGWGESRKERKLAKKVARAEKHEAKKAARSEAKAERDERKRKSRLSEMTDEELRSKIERLKLEKEYKELNKNPVVETGVKLIKAYFNSKDQKLKREIDRGNMIIRDRESQAKLINAKAANKNATNDLIDNIFSGKGKKKAKAELIKTKADNQVRGAVRKAISGIITKEGRRIANDMDEHSRTMKIGRGIKKTVSNAREKSAQRVVDMLKNASYKQAGIKRPKGSSDYTRADAHPNTHPTSGKIVKKSKGWNKKK